MPPPPAPWRTLGAGAPPPPPEAIPVDADDRPERSRARTLRHVLVAGLVGGLVGALVVTGAYVAIDDDPTTSAGPGVTREVIVRPSREVAREGDIAEILAKNVPAVVAIVADGGPGNGGGAGTGFVISDDGVIVTNNHVVEFASRIGARFSDGTELDARVLGTDPGSDLAVLQVEGAGLPTIVLGDSDSVQVGDDVVAIGNALALEGGLSVTRGIVSGLDRTVPTSRNTALAGVIQTDAAINPGNSGGPLVDSRGRVIGINTAIADPSNAQNVGFAIPISQARPIIDALRSGNRPAYLGVTIDTEAPGDGAVVREVAPDTPADRAGMRSGDVIVSIGGRTVGSWEQLRPAIRENRPGDSVDVVVERDGERRTLRVTLEEDPGSS
jgi:putative serine protease PepD